MRMEKHTCVTGPSMSGSVLSIDFPALKHGTPLPRIPKIDHLYPTQESPQPPVMISSSWPLPLRRIVGVSSIKGSDAQDHLV